MSRLIAVKGGGDWADASVDHLVLPEGVDVEAEKLKWRAWYRDEYLSVRHGSQRLEYMGLTEWLKTRAGAREADEKEIEVVWDE